MDGTPFGRYRLIDLLGRGGMGEVWRAHDTSTNRTVAIKLLPAHLAQDHTFVQRFRREAELAAQLNSPHVVPIHDYGEIDGRLFVNMRLIEGRDLQEVLSDGPLQPDRAVRIVEQVARALNAAHKRGLVHRDVKPSNILLDEDDFAYLIDFGIARGADQTRMTGTGGVIGSWPYMSPERLRAGQVDARSDVYALACVLYECLTGATPFPGDNTEQQITAHFMEPPPRPSIADPNVPAELDSVVATGMAKDPDQRYATTVELASAAQNAVTAPIAQPTENLRAPAAFVATPAAPKMPATEAADLSLAATQQGPVVGPPPDMTKNGRSWWPPRGRPGLIAAIIVAVVVLVSGVVIYQLQPSGSAQSATSSTPAAMPPPPPPPPPKPVEEAALDGLLLSPAEINAAMGATGMTVEQPWKTLADVGLDNPSSPPECLPLGGAGEAPVYNGSGFAALRGQTLQEPQHFTHAVDQFVLLFPSAAAAAAFYSTSTQGWQACANRSYHDNVHNVEMNTGPVSTANGMLSNSETNPRTKGWTCQRALTARNNVVVDVAACGHNTTDQGVSIAAQIAAKVPTSP
ncbi:serine/threonine-protein kinase PknH/PknJ [Mycobacterium rhizamassiliense]|uniref:serine/threonine-protein kinase PknH/PknJ n=1 Tax=Mycobacterium rhizamassiliense TaxID=1841860 RepID=UPI0009FA61C4|nr:serine/threonine-protein kinase PknH/PknJ [Mycobacterium rhizamassiliense]